MQRKKEAGFGGLAGEDGISPKKFSPEASRKRNLIINNEDGFLIPVRIRTHGLRLAVARLHLLKGKSGLWDGSIAVGAAMRVAAKGAER